MDIPEAAGLSVPRRNANITGAKRSRLIIDPGPRSISGKNREGREYYFDTGAFMGKSIYLGELRTDDMGRLLFLGGRGWLLGNDIETVLEDNRYTTVGVPQPGDLISH